MNVERLLQIATFVLGLAILVFRSGVWTAERKELKRRLAELERILEDNVRKRLHVLENSRQTSKSEHDLLALEVEHLKEKIE